MQSNLINSIFILFCINCANGVVGIDEKPLNIGGYPVRNDWREEERAYPIVFAPVPADLPGEYQINPFPEVGDQGIQASGSAWAIAYASSARHRQSAPQQLSCSPSFLYNMLNRGINEGIELHSGLDLHRMTGCPPLSLMPYNPNDYSHRPSPEAFDAAKGNRIAGFGRVDYLDVNQVRGHLFQNSAVMVTLTVYQNFLNLKRSDWDAPAGKPAGRHSLTVIGYSDAKRAFLLQNSVGESWGDHGRCWIPYDWFIRLTSSAFVLW